MLLARASNSIHNPIAILPLPNEFQDQCRRILQIAIDLNGGIPHRIQVRSEDRALESEIARKPECANATVSGCKSLDDLEGAIIRVIVRKQKLKVIPIRDLRHDRQ